MGRKRREIHVNRLGTEGKGEGGVRHAASKQGERLAVPDCAVPGDAVWGVVGTTTHRRKEVCGGQATVVGHSVC